MSGRGEHGKIIAHNDFDGVVSAAIVSRALGVDRFMFTGPSVITDSRMPVGENDIVCDLPYPVSCGLWFDHHEGNLEDVRLRGKDPSTIPGSFELRDSCARVVYEYFSSRVELPGFYESTVDEADVLDGFKFTSIEDWRRETAGKIVDGAMHARERSPGQRDDFLSSLVRWIRDYPLEEVAGRDDIRRAYTLYLQQEEKMIKAIRDSARFTEDDPEHEVVLLDFTAQSRPPRVMKKLSFLIFPEAKAVLEIRNPVRNRVKTTDLSVSMSLGIGMSQKQHPKNIGEIMRELNIGDGHAGAGSGRLGCRSKAEMLREKGELIQNIFKMWKSQQ